MSNFPFLPPRVNKPDFTETLTGLSYNAGTGDLTYTDENGSSTVISLPTENFLASASYNQSTNVLTLTLSDASTVDVDLTDLVGEQVQADWNETDSEELSFILNKPTIPTATSQLTNDSNFAVDASYVHTDNNYTTAEKSKLSGIEAGAEVNLTASELKTAYEGNDDTNAFTDALLTKLNGIESGAEANAVDSVNGATGVVVLTAANIAETATRKWLSDTERTKLTGVEAGAEVNVQSDWDAISGDALILNKPTIPSALADLSDDATHRTVTDTEKATWNGKSDFDGAYSSLSGLPTLPTQFSDLTDDVGYYSVLSAFIGFTEHDNGSSGTAKTIDLANGNHQLLTLTDNCTITLSNTGSKSESVNLRIVSSGAYSITWPAGLLTPAGAGLSAAAKVTSQIDMVTIVSRGTTYFAQEALAFAVTA